MVVDNLLDQKDQELQEFLENEGRINGSAVQDEILEESLEEVSSLKEILTQISRKR